MTSAMLSVGIKTDEAKKNLSELKRWMAQEMKGVVLDINENAIHNSIQTALNKKKFLVTIDDVALGASVAKSLKDAFGVQQSINFNGAALTAQIRQAVEAGTGGAKLGVSGVGGGTDLNAFQNAIHFALTPAVDALVKATGSLTTALRTGEPVAVKSRASARSSFSSTNEATGERLSFSKTLEDPDQVKAVIRAAEAMKAAEKQQLDDRKLMHKIAAAERVEIEAEALARSRALIRSAPNIDPRTLLGLPSRDAMKSIGAEIAAQFREPIAQEMARMKSAPKIDPRTLLGLPSRESMRAMGAEIAAQFRESVTLETMRTKSAPKLDPSTLLGLPPPSAWSGTAKASAEAFGLFKPEESLKKALPHTRAMSEALRDMHSGARGLAGSLGMLWVTWGSTVPIVAMAALGGTLRSVFQVGKDLEYQLKFVSVLSDGAAVSMLRFGDAVRGSMAAPTEAAQAMRALAQNGLTVNEAFIAMPNILALATAGEMSLSEAALGATGVMTAFGLSVTDIGRVGDVFAKAAAESNTSVSQMVESMKQASTISDQYKVSLEETAASLATMAKRNITGTAAGTAFRNMMTELATPSEHARKAMDKLGLSLYDSNNQLKSFDQVMKQLSGVVGDLNEKSRLTFLNELFGERGAKAANALLSDAQKYNEVLSELQQNSNGFARSVVAALSETTQGKIKALITEFQITTATAFNESKDSIKNFIDEIRAYVSSTGFKEFVSFATEAVINLTKYLREYGTVILWTVGALKLASLGLAGYAKVAEIVAGGMVALRAASLGALGAMTGGVGLAAVLVTEYFLLRQSIDKVTEADKARVNQMQVVIEEGKRYQTSLQEEINLLDARIEALYRGADAEKAAGEAKRNLARETVTANLIEGTSRENNARAKLQELEAARKQGSVAVNRVTGGKGASSFQSELETELSTAIRLREASQTQMRQLDETHAKETEKREKGQREKALAALEAYNKAAIATNLNGKLKEKLKTVNIEDYRQQPTDVIERTVEGLTKKGNQLRGQYERPNADVRSEDLAQSRAIIEGLREREAALKQAIKFTRELNDASYSSDVFGPYFAAKLQENEARKESVKLIQLEKDAVAQIQGSITSQMKAADRTNLNTEIERRRASIKLMEVELDFRNKIANAKAAEAERKSAKDFSLDLRKVSSGAQEALDEIRRKGDTRVEDGGDVARRAAASKIEASARTEILKREEQIEQARAGVLEIQRQLDSSSERETTEVEKLLAHAQNHLSVEESRLAVLRQQVNESKQLVGDAAREEFNKSQTAEFGWRKFWKTYTENATSAAQQVQDIMKVTTDSMSNSIVKFVMTGKGGFKEFTRSILSEAVRILSSRAIMQLLQMGFAFFNSTPAFGPQSVANGGTGSSWAYANGGIMTSRGNLPLNRYEGGGIARSAQIAMFGEGRKPEAYVPLPDGRSIPVSMQGGGGAVNVNTEVHVHSDGQTNVSTDVNGGRGGELGRAISDAVIAEIVKQKRPGGILARV